MALKFEGKSCGAELKSVIEYLNAFSDSNNEVKFVSVVEKQGFHVVVGYEE